GSDCWFGGIARGSLESEVCKMNVIAKVVMILVSTVLAEHAMAQGVVFFSNQALPGPSSGWPERVVRDVGGAPLSGTNFIAQLLYQDRAGIWVTHPIAKNFFD